MKRTARGAWAVAAMGAARPPHTGAQHLFGTGLEQALRSASLLSERAITGQAGANSAGTEAPLEMAHCWQGCHQACAR